jgi:hypothetical protein
VQDECISASADESGAAGQAVARIDELHATMPFKISSPLTKPFTNPDSLLASSESRSNGTVGGVLPTHA